MTEQKTVDPNHTIHLQVAVDEKNDAKEILREVYLALEEKGYHSINQLIGYFLSGDPTYITSYNNARSLIRRIERDELLEEILREYIQNNVTL